MSNKDTTEVDAEKALSRARNELVDNLVSASHASQHRGDMYAPIYDDASNLKDVFKKEIIAMLAQGDFPAATQENAPNLVAYIENTLNSCFDEVFNDLIDRQIASVNPKSPDRIASCIEVFSYSSEFKSSLLKAFSAKLENEITPDEIGLLERVCSEVIDQAATKLYTRLQNESYSPEGVMDSEQAINELEARKRTVTRSNETPTAAATKVTPGLTMDNVLAEMEHTIGSQISLISRHRVIAKERGINNPELNKALKGCNPYRTSMLLLDNVRALLKDKSVDNFILACHLEKASSILLKETSLKGKDLAKEFEKGRSKFIYDAQADPDNNLAKFNSAFIENAAKMSNLILHLNPGTKEEAQPNETMSAANHIINFANLYLENAHKLFKRSTDNTNSAVELLQLMGKAFDVNTIKSVKDFYTSPDVRNGIAALIKANPQVVNDNAFIDVLIKFNQFAALYGAEPLAIDNKELNKKISQRQQSPKKEIIFEGLASDLGEKFRHVSSSSKAKTLNRVLYDWLKAQPSLINPDNIQRGQPIPAVIEFRHEKDNKSTRKIEIRGNNLVIAGFSPQMLESFKDHVLKELDNLDYVQALDPTLESPRSLVRTKTVLSLSPRLSQSKAALQSSSDNLPNLVRSDSKTATPERKASFTSTETKPPAQETESKRTSFKRKLSSSALLSRIAKRVSRPPPVNEQKTTVTFETANATKESAPNVTTSNVTAADQTSQQDEIDSRVDSLMPQPVEFSFKLSSAQDQAAIMQLAKDFNGVTSDDGTTVFKILESTFTIENTANGIDVKVSHPTSESNNVVNYVLDKFPNAAITINAVNPDDAKLIQDATAVFVNANQDEFSARARIGHLKEALQQYDEKPITQQNAISAYAFANYTNDLKQLKGRIDSIVTRPLNAEEINMVNDLVNQYNSLLKKHQANGADSTNIYGISDEVVREANSLLPVSHYSANEYVIADIESAQSNLQVTTPKDSTVTAKTDISLRSKVAYELEQYAKLDISPINQVFLSAELRDMPVFLKMQHQRKSDEFPESFTNRIVKAAIAQVNNKTNKVLENLNRIQEHLQNDTSLTQAEKDKAYAKINTLLDFENIDSKDIPLLNRLAGSFNSPNELVNAIHDLSGEKIVQQSEISIEPTKSLNTEPAKVVLKKSELEALNQLEATMATGPDLHLWAELSRLIERAENGEDRDTVYQELNDNIIEPLNLDDRSNNQKALKFIGPLENIAREFNQAGEIPFTNAIIRYNAKNMSAYDDCINYLKAVKKDVGESTLATTKLDSLITKLEAIKLEQSLQDRKHQLKAVINEFKSEINEAIAISADKKPFKVKAVIDQLNALRKIDAAMTISIASPTPAVSATATRAATATSTATATTTATPATSTPIEEKAETLLSRKATTIEQSSDSTILRPRGKTQPNIGQDLSNMRAKFNTLATHDLAELDVDRMEEVTLEGLNKLKQDLAGASDNKWLSMNTHKCLEYLDEISRSCEAYGKREGNQSSLFIDSATALIQELKDQLNVLQAGYDSQVEEKATLQDISQGGDEMPNLAQNRKEDGYVPGAAASQDMNQSMASAVSDEENLFSDEQSSASPRSKTSDDDTSVQASKPVTAGAQIQSKEAIIALQSAKRSWLQAKDLSTVTFGVNSNTLQSSAVLEWVTAHPDTQKITTATGEKYTFPKGAELEIVYSNNRFIARGFTPEMLASFKAVVLTSQPEIEIQAIDIASKSQHNLALKRLNLASEKNTYVGGLSRLTQFAGYFWKKVQSFFADTNKSTVSEPTQSESKESTLVEGKRDTTKSTNRQTQSQAKNDIEMVELPNKSVIERKVIEKEPPVAQTPKSNTNETTTQVAAQSNRTTAVAANQTNRRRTMPISNDIAIRLMVSLTIEEKNDPKEISTKLSSYLEQTFGKQEGTKIDFSKSNGAQLSATILITTEHGLKKPLTVEVDKTGRVTISSVAPDADQRKIMLDIMKSATSPNDPDKVRVTVSSFPGREMAQKNDLINELQGAGYNLKPPEQGRGRSFTM